MTDISKLAEQCQRWAVAPGVITALEAETSMSAHALLQKLHIPPGTILQFALGWEWQLSISGDVIHTGSFEDCVTTLAERCEP